METLAERIKYARESKGLSQQDVAKMAGISQPTFFKIENGLTQKPRNILDIAKALGVQVDWLATGDGDMTPKPTIAELQAKMAAIVSRGRRELVPTDFLSLQQGVPVISWVAAGSWTESTAVEWLDDDTQYLPRPANLSAQGFCLAVRGESMMPEFRPSDIIYVEPQVGFLSLKSGDLVVVREQGNQEATFKQLVIGDTSDDMYLRPLNPNWHEQRMTPKSEWELVGKVVGKWVRYD